MEVPPPKEAFFSGYYMNYTNFQNFVRALKPDSVEWLERNNNFVLWAVVYKEWRQEMMDSGLSVDEQKKILAVKIILEDPYANTPNMGADRKNVFLFPTRPCEPAIHGFPPQSTWEEEAGYDRVCRDNFIPFIPQSARRYLLDNACMRFGCFKDLHPYWDTPSE